MWPLPIQNHTQSNISDMNLNEAMSRLEALGSEKTRAQNAKNGAGDNQFGVRMGDLRVLAKEIKTNPELAAELWDTGNIDARCLAILLMKPKELPAEKLEAMVRDVSYHWLADWLNSYVVKQHPEKEGLRQKWMGENHPSLARSAWSLTAEKAEKNPDGLDFDALLDRLEKEMKDAPELAKWTMNMCLANIGIHRPDQRKRALAIGEKLGVYRDYPTPKGCTSPFAPIWINFMVSRQG